MLGSKNSNTSTQVSLPRGSDCEMRLDHAGVGRALVHRDRPYQALERIQRSAAGVCRRACRLIIGAGADETLQQLARIGGDDWLRQPCTALTAR